MMTFNANALSDFARFYGFHYGAFEPESLVRDLLIDMERGLAGQASSLQMIPSYLTPAARPRAGKKVLALDAGGTNLRAAVVSFDEAGKAFAASLQKAPMPGTRGRVSADEFFDQIAALAAPLLETEKDLAGMGFTFSYPMTITRDADGLPTAFSKELDAPEVLGRPVGAELRRALGRRGISFEGPIVLLNDTAATLLSGLSLIAADGGEGQSPGLAAGPVIGLILGTGFNTAYPEQRIPKIGFDVSDAQSAQIVVCETGAFALRFRGPLDLAFDRATKNPGAYSLEKTTSGAYLGPLTLFILKQAVRDGVLAFARSSELLEMPHLETRDLNDLQRCPGSRPGPLGALFGADEEAALASALSLASLVTERGALFSAAAAAAAAERLRQGGDFLPQAPLRIAVEGTTYLRYKGMRRAFEAHLHRMLNREKPCAYVVSPVEQASLLGAAVAALSPAGTGAPLAERMG
ncbi:MAG: hexokinase [Treponema sp.]|jgi:hexokinase|nr:hexokinase [Treponema sp.]